MRMTTPTTEVRLRGDDREEQGAMWSYVPMERRIRPITCRARFGRW